MRSLEINWQPKQSPKITRQQIGNETILLDGKGKAVHILNTTADVIWQCCDGNHTVAQIEAVLREQFDVSAETALTKDVTDTLILLQEKGLLK